MSDTSIGQLIEDLGSKSGSARHAARRALVALGDDAVDALIGALTAKAKYARWGAAKALGQMRAARAAPALVAALEDDESDVRWLAATALAGLDEDGLKALLRAIVAGDLELHHHHAAHHVLHDLVDAGRADAAPVLEALEGPSPKETTPPAAAALLLALRE